LIARLAGTVGTPFWVYDAAAIERQIAKLRAFDIVRYAQKANSNLSILQVMRRNGVLVDAVSLGEIERALAAGFTASADKAEIVFTADLLDRETLRRVAALGIPVNCGSPDMIGQIGEASPGHPVWLRINPGFGHGHSAKTNTGGPSSKHGIWFDQLPACLEMIDRCGVSLVGLHMHIGSGVDYGHLGRVGGAMVEAVKQLGRPIEAISAGGGLSVPYRSGEAEVDAQNYFQLWDRTRQAVSEICGAPVRLEIEPGRYLVAGCGKLVAEVRAVKKVADKHFVLVDAGFNELARPMAYGAHHDIRFVSAAGRPIAEDRLHPMAIAGPLCESGDVFTQRDGGVVEFRELPLPSVGDLAVFEDAGAYGASMSSNYNSRPLAPEVMVDAGKVALVRRRQEVRELLALEAASPLKI
jgi:diaminopimelate decarboxylase